MSHQTSVDPVTIEVVRNALTAIAEQMGAIIRRSAHSTVVREILDFSTGVFDSCGRMTAQASAIPLQILTLGPPLKRVLQTTELSMGDVILTNDPYLADAQHLPDFTMFRPVFFEGKRVAILGDMAHQIDCGGRSPGSYGSDVTEIFQEGLRIPPIKIHERGRVNKAIEAVLAANSRQPAELLGDVRAQIAALEVGEREYQRLCSRFGSETLQACAEELITESERRTREAILNIPDGTYQSVQLIDDDGVDRDPIPLRVALTVLKDEIVVDFTGSAAQRRGSINATLAMTRATVQYVIMAVLGADIPQNEGCFRPVHIVAPGGSILNACSPAAVVGRVLPCHRLVDLLLGALGQAVPDKIVAGYYGNSNIYTLGGLDRETGHHWVAFDIEVGGWGARPTKDGLDGYSAHIHNMQNTPIEMVEARFPLRIERYEFINDSGGEGKYRGGLGLRRDIRVLCDDAVVTALGDRFRFPPEGVFGGEPGAPGAWVLIRDGAETTLSSKITGVALRKGDIFSVRTQGGGGYGPVSERDADARAADIQQGKISATPIPKRRGNVT